MRFSKLALLHRCAGLAPVLLFAAATGTIGCAQSPPSAAALERQIEELRESYEGIQAELAELKEMLAPVIAQLPQPFRPQEATVAGSPVMGKADAPVTMIEFSDLQCPFCVRYYQQTFPTIVKEFVETDKVRYVVREFPLSQIHPQAQAASRSALCAGNQDKYWEMRGRILDNRERLGDEDLAGYAEATGLDMERWEDCMETEIHAMQVDVDLEAGAQLGVKGTPAFAIGLTDKDDPDKILVTKLIEGAYPFEAFQKAIQELLDSDQ